MGTILWMIASLVLIIALEKYALRRVPQIRGALGERKVRKLLEKVAPEGYRILNNVLIRTAQGTAQIDHIVITPYGILVVETKNYKGWIFGSEESEYWTQVLNGRARKKFRNPVRQNWGHICALKEVLPEYADVPFHSIIVLAGSAKHKTLHDVQTKVIYPDMLRETILNCRGIEVLKETDMETIYNRLRELALTDPKAYEEHIIRVKQAFQDRQAALAAERCPWCDSRLVKRSGKFGDFYGCSRFPKCKYTTANLQKNAQESPPL